MNESNFELVEGSDNVFRDFGDPDADLQQAKAVSRPGSSRCWMSAGFRCARPRC